MRSAFVKRFIEHARTNERLFLICGDLGYSVLEPYAKEFPGRFLNAGVAEQNMTGIAAGLAKEGYNVFTYSIGNFPILRCLEQLRYDVCYHELSVKVVAIGGGFAYGALGASHHATEDLAVMRALPNMTVLAPGDPNETIVTTDYLCAASGPGYLRLNKAGDAQVHKSIPVLSPFKPIYVMGSGSTVVLACGAVLADCAKTVGAAPNRYRLFSVPFVSPLDQRAILDIAESTETIVTIEEHQLKGGFGSAIAEVLIDAHASGLIARLPRVIRKGIRDRFTAIAGSQAYLRAINAINLE